MEHTFWDVSFYCVSKFYFCSNPSTLQRFIDNEFTQLMKGLQGERLRQAFKYLDEDQDGFIRPDQFKRIILVCPTRVVLAYPAANDCIRKLQDINYQMP